MDQNFWAFVALGLLIVIPFVVIVAKALGAGRRPPQNELAEDGKFAGDRDT